MSDETEFRGRVLRYLLVINVTTALTLGAVIAHALPH